MTDNAQDGTYQMSARGPTRALMWTCLLLIALLFLFPFVYLLSTSVKTSLDSIAVPPTLFPTRHLALQNYSGALQKSGVLAALINSATIAVLSTAITLVLAVPSAYVAGFFAPRLGRPFLLFALMVRIIPPIVIGIPYASFVNDIHLSDTPIAVAVGQSAVALPLTVWLLAGFFEAVPRDLHDAATVDGCSRWQAMVRIVFPLLAGGIAVSSLFAFLTSWNDYLFALLLTATRSQTMPIAIANFQTQYGLDWGPMTALSVMYTLPVVVLTLLLQRRIVAGMTIGAVRE